METREEEENSWIPRGGPIFLPNTVGPLTRVPEFQSSVLHLLQDLEALGSSSVSEDDDISTDDLKVFTDEELTAMAMEEAFGDEENSENNSKQSSQSFHLSASDHKDSSDKNADLHSSGGVENSSPAFKSSSEQLSGSKSRNCKKRRAEMKKMEKSRKKSNEPLDKAIVAKVERLAKIKQKQDEEKLAARLHCLNTCETDEGVTPSSKGVERLQSLRSTNNATKLVESSEFREPVPILFPEVVLCIEIYNSIRKIKTQEILVLGHQMLTELKDKIYCLTDQMMKKAGQYDPSGYFLIEDTFCNDLRDPSAADYSKPILDWLRNSKDEALRKWESILVGELQQKQKEVLGEAKPMDLPHFKAVDMHKIRFCDLRFRLGARYLYCHQGDCKHRIVIRDMRLIHPEDNHNRAAYPRVIFQRKPHVRKCSVCGIYRASMFAVDDKWAQDNPCYFCDYCFSLLHSEDGPLRSDFPLYDYLHD